MISTTVASTAAALAGLAGTALSAAGTLQNTSQAKEASRQQAAMAERKQHLAEKEASEERHKGYEAMLRERQATARAIGEQRARAGASGAQVDEGSFLDRALDTVDRGEQNALFNYQQGLDNAHNALLRAWDSGEDANVFHTRASNTSTNAAVNLGSTLIGGIRSFAKKME